MLKIVTDKDKILEFQEALNSLLKEKLTNEGVFKIGFPSGSWDSTINFAKNIWHHSYEVTDSSPRFWNGFGLASEIEEKKSNNIVVEINIPTAGINKRVSGFFAVDDKTNNVFLMHRGKIGGGRKGIGKNTFLGWYSGHLESVFDKNKEDKALLIGNIKSEDFIQKLTQFIKNVAEFKILTVSGDIDESTYLSNKELVNQIKTTQKNDKPQRKNVSTSVYERNLYVTEYAKRRADGKCELCKEKAPFKNKIGRPYLETHHIIWLSQKGDDTIENTVALCPNCHRKMHIVDSKKDKDLLKKIVKEI